MKTTKEVFDDRADEIAKQIIAQIEAGAGDWKMPWHDGIAFAMNRATGSLYGGANLMLLWHECGKHNYSKNYWATFKQWRKLGGMVCKGEKATRVAVIFLKKFKRNESQLVISEDMKDNKTLYTRFIVKYIPVFNIDQVDGLHFDQPDLFGTAYHGTDLIDDMVKKTSADIRHGGANAFYHRIDDFIQMPRKANFFPIPPVSALEGYYTTLLHELVHWTGHSNRCDRAYLALDNHERYAFEELVAELGCAILSTHFQQRVMPRPEHAQYLSSWLSVLKKDFNYYYQAQNQAIIAISWLFNTTKILPYQLKEKEKVQLKEKRLQEWDEIMAQSNNDNNFDLQLFHESFI